ncbi:MAG: hypothetical protein RJA34_1275 [Pseudomonadota bacterium]
MNDDAVLSAGLRTQATEDAGSGAVAVSVAEPVAALTAGQLLRQARESKGLHIAALAVSLKVPVKRLEALEADRYQDLPGAVFTRALASSVCRSLKVDAQAVLNLLPQAGAPVLATSEPSLNAPFKGSPAGVMPFTSSLGKPSVVLVIALVLATLILLGWPWLSDHLPRVLGQAAGDSSSSSATAAAGAPSAPTLAAAPLVEQTPMAPQAVAPVPAPLPAAVAAEATKPIAAVQPAEPVAQTAQAVSASVNDSSKADLSLKARGTVWIKVLDAQGSVLASKTLYTGEALPLSGAAPLSVVLGKADAVDVMVRGKAFDALAIARDNVARFEVK